MLRKVGCFITWYETMPYRLLIIRYRKKKKTIRRIYFGNKFLVWKRGKHEKVPLYFYRVINFSKGTYFFVSRQTDRAF